LSELLGEVAGEQVQVEVSAVRVLFELLGFLLKTKLLALSCQLSLSVKIKVIEFLVQISCIHDPVSDGAAGFRLQ